MTHGIISENLKIARVKTQFGAPGKPRCAKEGCNGWRWSGSPGGYCRMHAGRARSRAKRNTIHGQKAQALNRHRAAQKKRAEKLVLSIGAHKLVAQHEPAILPHDIYELRIAAHDLVDDGGMDSKTFRLIVAELRARRDKDEETRRKNNSPRPAPKTGK